MAFGGVLIGSTIEDEHIKDIAMTRISSPFGNATATGMRRFAVAVLLELLKAKLR